MNQFYVQRKLFIKYVFLLMRTILKLDSFSLERIFLDDSHCFQNFSTTALDLRSQFRP